MNQEHFNAERRKTQPQFKKGDKVKYNTNRYSLANNNDGIGTIYARSGQGWYVITETGQQLMYAPEELTLVNPPVKSAAASNDKNYNFKVTSASQVDIERICKECPEEENLILIESGSDNKLLAVRAACPALPVQFYSNPEAIDYMEESKNLITFGAISGKKPIPGWLFRIVWDQAETTAIITCIKKTFSNAAVAKEEAKKINIKVTYP